MAITNVPSNVGYGTVIGQFILAYGDGSDGTLEPDAVPASGSVIFTPSTRRIKDATATPNAVTILPAQVECQLDADGYILGYAGSQGVRLIATDDTDLNPTGWTWSVEFRLTDPAGDPVKVDSFSFALPKDTTVDLTVASPVPGSNGTYYVTGPQGPAGSPGSPGTAATITVGTTTTGTAGSSASVTNSGTSSAAVLDFTIPRGATGDTGPANTLSIGTVTSGTTPSATITGTAPNQTLNLVLAKGDTGATGAGVQTGGTTNQLLAKASNTDYDTQWVDAPNAANGIPTGGAQYTMLVKNSATNYDTSWTNTIDGGTA